MKLFYDMLIPYMPDKDLDENGQLVPSKIREAGRNAMSELSEFQQTGAIICLYNAVFQACIYSETDLIDEILNLPKDLEIPEVSIEEAVDICARMLFESVNPNNKFDIDKFAGILLTSAHFAIEAIKANEAKKRAESDIKQEPEIQESEPEQKPEVDEKQVTIDDIIQPS